MRCGLGAIPGREREAVVWFHVFGQVRVFDDLQAELPLSQPTLRQLLAALLLQANQAVSPGRLAELLWQDARARRIRS